METFAMLILWSVLLRLVRGFDFAGHCAKLHSNEWVEAEGRCRYVHAGFPTLSFVTYDYNSCPHFCALSYPYQQTTGEVVPGISGRLMILDRPFSPLPNAVLHSAVYRCRNSGNGAMSVADLCFADSEHYRGPPAVDSLDSMDPQFYFNGPGNGDCVFLYNNGEFWQAECERTDQAHCLCEWTVNCPALVSGFYNTDSTLRLATIPEGRVYKTAEAVCDAGYSMVGNGTMSCARGPVWSAPQFHCVRDPTPGPKAFVPLEGELKIAAGVTPFDTLAMGAEFGDFECANDCMARDGSGDGNVCFAFDIEVDTGACRLFAQPIDATETEVAGGFRVYQLKLS